VSTVSINEVPSPFSKVITLPSTEAVTNREPVFAEVKKELVTASKASSLKITEPVNVFKSCTPTAKDPVWLESISEYPALVRNLSAVTDPDKFNDPVGKRDLSFNLDILS